MTAAVLTPQPQPATLFRTGERWALRAGADVLPLPLASVNAPHDVLGALDGVFPDLAITLSPFDQDPSARPC